MNRLILQILTFLISMPFCSLVDADQQMLRTRSGIMVPLLPPEVLRQEIFRRGGINIRIETAFRHLQQLDKWPEGYRELIEEFVLSPEKAKLHTFSFRDWQSAVEALHAQVKRRAEPMSEELTRKISASKILADIIAEDDHPEMKVVFSIEEALKKDSLLAQSLSATLDSPLSSTQRKRLAPHFMAQVIDQLSDQRNLTAKTVSDLGVIIRRYDLKGNDINRLFAEGVQANSMASAALLREAFRPDASGWPSEILRSTVFQKSLAQSRVASSTILHDWKTSERLEGDALVAHFRQLPNWSESRVLHEFVARLASETDLTTFRSGVRALDGTGTGLRAAMTNPENVDWLVDNRPDLLDQWFPQFRFLRKKAGWQIDAEEFRQLLGRNSSLDSKEILVLSRLMSDLSQNRALPQEMLKAWQTFIEAKVSSPIAPHSRVALVESVRKLQLWSPLIEKELVAWIATDKLGGATGTTDAPVISIRTALLALREAQLRGQLNPASEEAMVKGLVSPIGREDSRSLTGQRRKFSEVFYGPAHQERQMLMKPWLDLVDGMGNSEAFEIEARKILDAFRMSQVSFPKSDVYRKEYDFLFDQMDIGKVFAALEGRENVSENFRSYLVEFMKDPKMRRAIYEFSPGAIAKFNLPMTAEMRAEIKNLQAGKEFAVADQLWFAKPRESTTLEGFLGALLKPKGPIADIYEFTQAAQARPDQVSEKSGTGVVRLFPGATQNQAVPRNISRRQFDELEKLGEIEKWTNQLLGEAEFDRSQFSQDFTESEVAIGRIQKALAEKSSLRRDLMAQLLGQNWPLVATDQESLNRTILSVADQLSVGEKAELANRIFNGEFPKQAVSQRLLLPMIEQVATAVDSRWTPLGNGAISSPSDFRIAYAMLKSAQKDASASFFSSLRESDLKVAPTKYLEIHQLILEQVLNPESAVRLKQNLTTEFGATLRRSDFLQNGPHRAKLALSLLSLSAEEDELVQAGIAARKGAITGIFFQTRRSEVPNSIVRTGSFRAILKGCAEAYLDIGK